MKRLIRPAAGLAVAGALALTAFAAVTPDEGTIGTEYTATFEGDLGNKPKIDLRFVDVAKKSPKAKAKVLSVNGGEVRFVIQAAKGGGTFEVGLKKSDEVAGTLTLVPPRVDRADKDDVSATDDVGIEGAFFGEDDNKRNAPKVFVNGKKAKTVEFSDDMIRIVVHKKTPPGLADVTVQNKIGETTIPGLLNVLPPPKPIKGKDSLSVKINGKAMKAKASKKSPEAAVAVLSPAINMLQITAVKNSGNPRKQVHTQNLNLNILLGEPLDGLALPATFRAIDLGTYLDSLLKIGGGIPPRVTDTTAAYGTDRGGSISLTIDSYDGERIAGTFSGSMAKGGGEGPANVELVGGEFVLTVQQ